jgi:hypothetical protein
MFYLCDLKLTLNEMKYSNQFFNYIAFLFLVLTVSCSKQETPPVDVPEEELEEEQLSSCVTYSTANQDDLYTYWELFVADVLCSRGGPDYSQLNTTVSLAFIVPSEAEITSGVTPDHAGYSTYSGYCNSSKVNIRVIKDYWDDYTEVQRLWLMYHEFGHDVYKYEHSTDRADIMYPSVPRSDVKLNDFIKAKDKFFSRNFVGVSYIQCPN